MWAVTAEDFSKPWAQLKQLGLEAIAQGQTEISLAAWPQASSAHLAVLVCWWQAADARGSTLVFSGLNPTFRQLAALGGVTCIETGERDAGH